MKRFLLSILLAFLPVFGLEYLLRSLPHIYKYKMDYMKEHRDEVNTLILGHSEVANGINPSLLNEICVGGG